MGGVKKINGRYVLTPEVGILGNIQAGVLPNDAVNKTQLDAVSQGTIDLSRVEFSANGTAAAPVLTWNTDTTTGLYLIGAANIGISAGGTKIVDIAATGLAVTGLVSATTTVTAGTGLVSTTTTTVGTSVGLGTDIIGVKEVNHVLSITTTTTAATVGGSWTITGGTGATSGNGGAVAINGGVGGATAGSTGGAVTITTGASGAGGGPSGAATFVTAAGTVTGAVVIGSGNGTTNSGNINITPGTSGSATVASAVILDAGVVRKPFSTSVASGGTITGPQLLKGLITCTGATGNWQLPTAAQITTALGATPAGTIIEFYVNAAGMTATNTATLVVGTNMTVQSAPPITGGGTLTITQDTQVMAKFILMYDTATTCKLARVA